MKSVVGVMLLPRASRPRGTRAGAVVRLAVRNAYGSPARPSAARRTARQRHALVPVASAPEITPTRPRTRQNSRNTLAPPPSRRPRARSPSPQGDRARSPQQDLPARARALPHAVRGAHARVGLAADWRRSCRSRRSPIAQEGHLAAAPRGTPASRWPPCTRPGTRRSGRASSACRPRSRWRRCRRSRQKPAAQTSVHAPAAARHGLDLGRGARACRTCRSGRASSACRSRTRWPGSGVAVEPKPAARRYHCTGPRRSARWRWRGRSGPPHALQWATLVWVSTQPSRSTCCPPRRLRGVAARDAGVARARGPRGSARRSRTDAGVGGRVAAPPRRHPRRPCTRRRTRRSPVAVAVGGAAVVGGGARPRSGPEGPRRRNAGRPGHRRAVGGGGAAEDVRRRVGHRVGASRSGAASREEGPAASGAAVRAASARRRRTVGRRRARRRSLPPSRRIPPTIVAHATRSTANSARLRKSGACADDPAAARSLQQRRRASSGGRRLGFRSPAGWFVQTSRETPGRYAAGQTPRVAAREMEGDARWRWRS